MMDPIQRAVANPPRKIVMQCAARRKVFWNIAPLAAGAQDVHHAVHDGPHFGPPLTAPTSGGRNQRLDTCPFVISQVARISQVIAVVLRPVLVRPQCKPLLESGWAPSNPSDSKESRSLRTDTKAILGETSYTRLYAHSSATLRPLNDQERAAIADLEIEQVTTLNAWIGIEDEFARAERSEIDRRVWKAIEH